MRPPRSMRPIRIAAVPILAAIVAVMAAACVSTASPGWTFAPSPPSSAAPSAAGSAAASGSPAVSASAASSAAPSGATGSVINLKAQNLAFDPKSLTAPAGAAFQIAFDNQDNATLHDVVIKDAGGKEVFKGDLITGVAQKSYNVPALQAGSYTFVCTVHPTMTGTLEAK